MPVFNEEKYLDSCIQSIISQDFKNWELIIVDDFSTDNSFQLLGQFAIKDPRISIYKNENKGIIGALRLAFRKSKGHFITRMDADDIMPVDKLSSLWSEIQLLGPGHISSGMVEYFSDDVLFQGFKDYEKWINQQFYYTSIYKECTLPSACWMAHRSDLLRIQAFEISQYPEDYDLLFRFYEAGYTIHGIDKVLHLWRDHSERASRNDPNYADQNFFPLKIEYFRKIDHNDSIPLILWGAGKKGKSLAKLLLENEMPFRWITDNEKKIGKHIYEVLIEDAEILMEPTSKQIITAISDVNFQADRSHLIERVHFSGNQYFHFC
ncbi:glycosyl transferase [Portibacter lacus]|uniref:Glycosyl transferase n=2 Tax=Portibacter lacus TaxID=1099794 RepID=A0AA37WEY7_9BACT|nr:glycosyl transferase [Portibacter lacus]